MPKSPSKGLRAFRRFTSAKSDAPPVPPLPPIPESLKPAFTKGLAKLLEKRKLRIEQADSEASTGAAAPSGKKNATLSAAFGRSSGRPALKTKYSNPELRLPKSKGSHKTSSSGSSGRLTPTSSRSPSCPVSQSIDEQVETYDKVDKNPASFALAPPRISPMEYTRTYLLEKAAAEREGRECQLPPPEQNWHWTRNWEGFLIVPSVPKSINREALPQVADPEEQDESDAESMTTVKRDGPPSAPCPRLSLNLGGMTTLFPSVMNLARLGMNDGNDSLSPSRSEASHRRHMRKSRSFSLPQHSFLTQITEEQSSDNDEPEHSLLGLRSRSAESLTRTEPGVGVAVPYDHAGTMAWLNRAEVSSLYSAESADTAVRVDVAGPSTPKSAPAYSPSSSPTVGADTGRGGDIPLSPSQSAVLLSPALARPVVEYSPVSYASSSKRRASTVSLSPKQIDKVKALVNVGREAGSKVNSQGVLERPSVGQSMSRQLEQAGSAVDNNADQTTPTTEPSLHPAPLKVKKQRSPEAKQGDAERCSIMWRGLSDEIGQKLAEFRKFGDADIARDSLAQRASQIQPGTAFTPTKKVRHPSPRGNVPRRAALRSDFTNMEQGVLEQHRAASALVSPSSSEFTIDSTWAPSLVIPKSESQSGFTPSGSKAEHKRRSVLPDSPTLPAQDTYGQGHASPPSDSLAKRRRQEKRQQLMSPRHRVQSEPAVPARDASRSASSPALQLRAGHGSSSAGGYPATAKTLSSRDSSFALNESKADGSVTMLPRLRASTPGSRSRSSGSQIPVPVSPATHFDQSPGNRVKRRPAALRSTTPLAFQRFDTAARLATVAESSGNRRKSSTSSADRDARTIRGPSSFSNLLRKYSRSRMNENDAEGTNAAPQGRKQSGGDAGARPAPGTVRMNEQPRRLRKVSSEGHALKDKMEQIDESRDGLTTSSESLMGLQSFIDKQSPSRLPSRSPAPSMPSATNELRNLPKSEPAHKARMSLGPRADPRPSRKLQKPSRENLRLARASSGRF